MHGNTTWTPEAAALLEREWLAGKEASQIAAQLGISRNAVLGRVWRQGLKREVVPAKAGATHGGKRTVSTGRLAALRQPTPRPPQQPARPHAEPPPPVTPSPAGWPKPLTPTAVRFMKRRHDQCAMILDDAEPILTRMVCGAPVTPGESWCPSCAARVFTGRMALDAHDIKQLERRR